MESLKYKVRFVLPGDTMFDIAVTRMSSKGQIVIPVEMRECFKKGEKLMIIRDDERILMAKASSLSAELKDDLEFARRTEAAFKRYKKGEFNEMPFEEFMKEAKKW